MIESVDKSAILESMVVGRGANTFGVTAVVTNAVSEVGWEYGARGVASRTFVPTRTLLLSRFNR
jgi:hypothetical protein